MARVFDPGRVAQHGFEYQKFAFYYLISFFKNNYDKYYYEGKEDVHFESSNTNENMLICIKVSSTFLTYNRVFKQAENSSHFIIVEKIKDDKFKIIDGFVPTLIPSTFEGEVNVEEILNAWEGKNFEYIVIKEYKKEKNYKLEAINKFYFMKNQYIIKDEKTGVYSFFTLIKDLENYILKNDFKQLILDLNYIIKIYGFLTSKYYILEKIEDKNKYANYKLIIDKYNMISFSLVKLGITKNATLYNQIRTNVQTLIEQEINVLKEV